jgi:uncharacterized delta-60 repeat protein
MIQCRQRCKVGDSLQRLVVACLAFSLTFLGYGLSSALAAAGDLDPTFDGDGIRVVNQSRTNRGQAAAVQADGKIVVAGFSNLFGTDDFAVMRFNTNGSLDPAFDGDGIQIVNQSGTNQGRAVAIQADGKIVVAGYSNILGTDDFAMMRFNTNGSLDPTFDGDGIRVVNQSGTNRGQAVAIQADGKIVVAGFSNLFGTDDFAVMRFNTNGSLDPTFDGDGIRVVNQSGTNRGQAVVIQANGKIVVAGYTNALGTDDFAVMRFNTNGGLDPTFDGDGIRVVNQSRTNRGQAVAIQADGKIVVAGYSNSLGTDDFAVMRFNTNGSLDPTFDGDGIQIVNQVGTNQGRAVVLQADGKVVVAGVSNLFGTDDFAVMRFNPNGSLDVTFGGDGIRVVNLSGTDQGQAVTLQADGKIVVAGYTNFLGTDDFEVMRFLGQ